MSESANMLQVEVAYASPQRQRLIALSVPEGTTALEAAVRSGIAGEFPEIDLSTASMGIFSRLLDGRSQPLPKDCTLEDGDRVEIYRPLLIDPKEARLRRAARRD